MSISEQPSTSNAIGTRAWRFVDWSDRCETAVRDLLALAAQDEVISFAGGLPIVSTLDRNDLVSAMDDALREDGDALLQYGAAAGLDALRDFLAERMRQRGVVGATAENILVVTGAQQGLDLVGRLFLSPGGTVACPFPIYPGCLAAWHPAEPEYIELDALRSSGGAGVGFAYGLPNFENPTGRRWSFEERTRLLADARAVNVPILEDDPYRDLRFDDREEPSMIALDAEGGGGGPYRGRVIYLGSVSKSLAPGLRLGWICAAPEVIQRLLLVKGGCDLHSSNLTQHLVLRLAAEGLEEQNAVALRPLYKARYAAMATALREALANEISFDEPAGGMFIWVRLRQGLKSAPLLKRALARGVGFVPGAACYPRGVGGEAEMRLNFTGNDDETNRIGVSRLAAAIRDEADAA